MVAIDLTPFGFTATESLAYAALVGLGPSSGYAVAKQLSIARANAYQALDGLVAKQAAALAGTDPRRYRAVQPQALLTIIGEAQARRLDRLEHQVLAQPALGAEPLVRLEGSRAIRETATRGIVRAERDVLCVAPAGELRALGPAFRARAAAGRPTSTWSLGPGADSGVVLTGELTGDAPQRHFPSPVLLLIADGALLASLGEAASGYWSLDPLIQGVVRAAISAITS
jgi:Sugar-specific transcriptional regulator TrmB